MALLRVNAVGSDAVLHGSPQPLDPALRHYLDMPGPVVILLHGYKYQPGSAHCPHDFLFAQKPKPAPHRIISWPRHLGYGPKRQSPGVAICFGWAARGAIRSAYTRAPEAGLALAQLCRAIQRLSPGRTIQVFSHSMGARVALQALPHLAPGTLRRLILMSAAEFSGVAEAALTTAAGRTCEVVHVTSRENDLYDFLMERVLRPDARRDPALGTHLEHLPNLRNVLLDDPATLTALDRLGFPIAPAQRRICHWSPYLRPGVFRLYRALLSEDLDMDLLDAALPDAPRLRWSRLLPDWRIPRPRPFQSGSTI